MGDKKNIMNNTELTKDEIELYDRQIRLWGISAQQRMRSSKVLLFNLGGLGTEITKNLVLSGIGHLTIVDDHDIVDEDLDTQFFLSLEDLAIGGKRVDKAKHRIQDMNPRVKIDVKYNLLENLEKELSQYDLVILTEVNDKLDIIQINEITHSLNIPLYVCGCHGLYGYIFVDLIKFDSKDEKLKNGNFSTKLGKLSNNREVIEVTDKIDDLDPTKIFEKIVTRNYYKTFQQVLQTARVSDISFTKKQMKRLTPAAPVIFASLFDDRSQKDFLSMANICKIIKKLNLPQEYTVSKEFLDNFKNNQLNLEFSPVCAVIGGAVAQDVINILGKRESPLNNFIIFDGTTLEMPIFEF
ncbi:related to DNA damage tolerance protein RHC31 [Saccharomycodes ludwigii]|uniref:Related to DNA damage tolerance protein RHC31 n=1 Tax=Saccharomycodes ludwigii TaxID=36035 RepID=A0A376BAW5_9ASCO|nr:hypothetical protein SCDLUD_000024 [Saccharomycodes ludwigii]KAH3902447.1 hypothetical protein SCDLUD_000024 [Saccharomycodes ludwigii]SSD61767.1 related to DNA damage tolerance protein RHC31 [Saccharomycodes ludwigii]